MDYEDWLEWREEYYRMEDIGGHKNLGVSVIGNLGKKSPKRVESPAGRETKKITKKRLKEGTVNSSIRTTKIEYLRYHTKTVGIVNNKGEYEIKPTKQCGEGDVVWVLEGDGTFTKTKIY